MEHIMYSRTLIDKSKSKTFINNHLSAKTMHRVDIQHKDNAEYYSVYIKILLVFICIF